jgi:large subunit ribosomal protein L23
MSIFNVFKKKDRQGTKKKENQKKPVVKKEIEKPKVKVVPKKEKKETEKKNIEKQDVVPEQGLKKEEKKTAKPKKNVKPNSLAWKVLVEPHVTEKATFLAEKNEYAFIVSKNANKTEVRKAIEDIYEVKVEGVRMISIPGKTRRIGKNKGFKSGYKKAIIKIKKGQEIEVLPK